MYAQRTNAVWEKDWVSWQDTAFELYRISCAIEDELSIAQERIEQLEKLLAIEQKHLGPIQ